MLQRRAPMRRKAPMKAKPRPRHTAAQQRHLTAVAGLGCLVCGGGAEIHHVRSLHGARLTRNHLFVLPLCPRHHRVEGGMGVGFHAGSETWQTIHGSESSLLIRVAKLLNPDGKPAWVVCEDCGEMLCNIHDCHTFDGYCDCPELGVWDLIGLDPYASGGALSSEALQSLVKVVYAQTEIPF